MRTVAIIQARLGSERFPRKVLADIGGTSMISRVVNQVRQCAGLDEIVVASPWEDIEIADEVRRSDVGWFGGHATDVLDRYYQCAERFNADVILRVTGDCPLWNPRCGEMVLRALGEHDYASNVDIGGTDGWDAEAFTHDALRIAHRESIDREHVTTHMRSSPQFFRVLVLTPQIPDEAKWSVDTIEDLERVRAVA